MKADQMISHLNKLLLPSLLLLMMGCGSRADGNQSAEAQESSTWTKDKGSDSKLDTTIASEASMHEEIYKDSIVVHVDHDFEEIKLKLTNLSQKKYQDLQQQQRKECATDTGAFFHSKGLRYHQTCDEVCSSFLTDLKNGVRMVVPSNYDQGLRGMVVSPECRRIAFYSSYDGIDFSDYYEYCSEIYFYHVHEGSGIQTLQPAWVYFTKAFTITEMFWINENTLMLKTYAEDRHQVGENKLNYRYYQATLQEN